MLNISRITFRWISLQTSDGQYLEVVSPNVRLCCINKDYKNKSLLWRHKPDIYRKARGWKNHFTDNISFIISSHEKIYIIPLHFFYTRTNASHFCTWSGNYTFMVLAKFEPFYGFNSVISLIQRYHKQLFDENSWNSVIFSRIVSRGFPVWFCVVSTTGNLTHSHIHV